MLYNSHPLRRISHQSLRAHAYVLLHATMYSVHTHCFSSHTTAGDDQDGRKGNDESGLGDGEDETLLGQGLGEQGDDNALGSTRLGKYTCTCTWQ